MRIRLVPTLIYLLLLYLINLARGAVGGFFVFLHFFIIALPAVSLLHLLLSYSGLRYLQDFSSFHALRGDRVPYRLRISNETPLFGANVRIIFKDPNPWVDKTMENQIITLGPGKRKEYSFELECPLIGMYTIGLEAIILSDMLNWIEIRPEVFFYTMYVYPRVYRSPDFTQASLPGSRRSGTRSGALQDFSSFLTLRPYRRDEPVNRMAWKRFSAQGTALVREYSRLSARRVIFYLDTRRERMADESLIRREDFSLELMISLAAELLERGTPLDVRIEGSRPFSLAGAGELQELVERCLDISFHGGHEMIQLYRRDLQSGFALNASILFISPDLSQELATIISHPGEGLFTLEAVINHTAADEDTKLAHRKILRGMGSAASRVRFSDDSRIQGGVLQWE